LLKRVISVNRVRVLNIVLAVFDYVFLLDPGLKSTFTQNKSCRSSFPLQLLSWANFKLLCEIMSFGWSNRVKIEHSSPVHHCASSDAHTGTVAAGELSKRRRAGDPRPPRTPFLSVHGPWMLLVRSFLLPRAHVELKQSCATARPAGHPLVAPLQFLAPKPP